MNRFKRLRVLMCFSVIVGSVGFGSVGANQTGRENMSMPLVTHETSNYNPETQTMRYRIEGYVRGQRYLKQQTIPNDIVLVLDQSDSMANVVEGTTGKAELLKSVGKFIDAVHDNATMTGADHRIAIVGYSDAHGSPVGTNILTTGGAPIAYINGGRPIDGVVPRTWKRIATDHDLTMAMMDVKTQLNDIKSGLKNYNTYASTNPQYGLKMADDILGKIPNTSDRKKTVVLFTDGLPTSNESPNDSNLLASRAIAAAKAIESKYQADIYSVALNPHANPKEAFQPIVHRRIVDINRFLHYVSSNFPNATSMQDPYTVPEHSKYYFTAANGKNLEAAFAEIGTLLVKPRIDLGLETQLHYTLPVGLQLTSEPIHVSVADYHGKGLWGADRNYAEAVVRKTPNEITISNFNFGTHYVNEDEADKGKKLIAEFEVKIDIDKITGMTTPISTDGAGLYPTPDLVDKIVGFIPKEQGIVRPKLPDKTVVPEEKPDPEVPAKPDPVVPEKPDPEVPAKPDPVVPEKPDPEVPAKPDPVVPEKPDPEVPAKPDPVVPEKPDPEVPAKPDPVVPEKPDPEVPAKPDPVVLEKPDPVVPEKTVAVVPDKPGLGVEVKGVKKAPKKPENVKAQVVDMVEKVDTTKDAPDMLVVKPGESGLPQTGVANKLAITGLSSVFVGVVCLSMNYLRRKKR